MRKKTLVRGIVIAVTIPFVFFLVIGLVLNLYVESIKAVFHEPAILQQTDFAFNKIC